MTNSLRDLFLFPSSLCSCLLTCADYRVLREASYKRRSPRDWWSSGAGGFSSWGFTATSSKAWWRNAGSWRNANCEANGGKLVLFFLLSAACVLILKTIVLMPPISSLSLSPPLPLSFWILIFPQWLIDIVHSSFWSCDGSIINVSSGCLVSSINMMRMAQESDTDWCWKTCHHQKMLLFTASMNPGTQKHLQHCVWSWTNRAHEVVTDPINSLIHSKSLRWWIVVKTVYISLKSVFTQKWRK